MAAAVNAYQFSLIDCLKLVDWNRPITQTDKKGAIPDTTPTTLQHLNMDAKHFIYLNQHSESPFKQLVCAAYKDKQELFNVNNFATFQLMHKNWVDLALQNNGHNREACWSQDIAIGSKDYIATVAAELSIKAKPRKIFFRKRTICNKLPRSKLTGY